MPAVVVRDRDYLIASIDSALTDGEITQLGDALPRQVGRFHARAVIVDAAALDVIDSFVSRSLSTTARANALQGAITVVIGIRPDVAAAMSRCGLRIDPVVTAHDLDAALALLDSDSDRKDARRC